MLRSQTERRLLLVLIAFLFCVALSSTGQKPPPPKSPAPLATAKSDLDRGDVDSAESALWSVLGSDPTNVEALTMLGVVRGRQERFAEAEALFRRVLQLNPKSTVGSRNLASALLAQNKPEEAIRAYERAIELSPQDFDLKLDVAKLQLARGNFEEALAAIEKIPPGRLPPAALPMKVASLLGVGRRSEAEGLIVRAQGSPAIALALAQVFVQADDPSAALKVLGLINPVPKGLAAPIYYLKGRAWQQSGNAAAAAASFRQARVADPKSIDTLLALAEIDAMENKHVDSLATLQKARELNPESRDVLRRFIVEAMRAGQNDKALQAAQDLQRQSTDLDDRYLVASVMIQQKQFSPASHILEDYVAQRPQEAKAYLGLGIAYLNLLRYPEARQALEKSLKLEPNTAEAEFQMGLLESQAGNRQGAREHWQKAAELQPRHAQALFSLGTVYLESGELAEAENAFSRSLAADPGNMKTEYNLALVLNKLGKSEEAKQHFDHYRKMQEEEHINSGNAPRGYDPK